MIIESSSPWAIVFSGLVFHQARGVVEGSEDVVFASEAPRAANEVVDEAPLRSTGSKTMGPSTNTMSVC
jgi:hypothetical protein